MVRDGSRPGAIRTPEVVSVRTWFTGGELRLTEAVVCPEPPDIVRSRLIEAVEAVDEPFTLVSKLSGGGIVTRMLRAPQTSRPLFGRRALGGAERIARRNHR